MHSTSQRPFGDRLRRYRVAAGLSQEALAERAGIAARTIGAIEQGTSTAPYRGTVLCLANALGIPDDERATFMAVSRFRRPRSRVAATVIHLDPHALPPSLIELVDRDENPGAMTVHPGDTIASSIEMTG